MNGDNEGNYTKISTDDFNQEIFEIKQEMLEKLWKAQHPEEQVEQGEQEQEQWEQEQEEPIYTQENDNMQTEQTGEQLIEEVMRNKIPYWCKEERKKELLAIYSNNEKKTSRRNV